MVIRKSGRHASLTRRAIRKATHKKYRQYWIKTSIICFICAVVGVACFISYLNTSYAKENARRILEECSDDTTEYIGDVEHTLEIDDYLLSNSNEDEGGIFPKDMFADAEDSGAVGAGIVVHMLVMVYMFIGLAIICDDYFEPALDNLVEALELSDDVAGATFMAAGGSAPELSTSIIGLFFAQNDIGFGTIVGSAAFNVLFVIAICAWVAPGLRLSWWPLARDCIFYCTSILVLMFCVLNNQINIVESIILLLMYMFYVLIMKYNEQLFEIIHFKMEEGFPEHWFRRGIRDAVDHIVSRMFIFFMIVLNFTCVILEITQGDNQKWQTINLICSFFFIGEYLLKSIGYGWCKYWTDGWNAVDGCLVLMIFIEFGINGASGNGSGGLVAIRLVRFFRFVRSIRIVRIISANHVIRLEKITQTREKDFNLPYTGLDCKQFPEDTSVQVIRTYAKHRQSSRKKSAVSFSHKKNVIKIMPAEDNIIIDNQPQSLQLQETEEDSSTEQLNDMLKAMVNSNDGPRPISSVLESNRSTTDDSDEDESDDGPGNLWELPDDTNDLIWYMIIFPYKFLFFYSIYDTTQEDKAKYWSVSFVMCVVWIAICSYFMVWMATLVGNALEIPPPIMGLTLLAGGTSIPDLLSSAAVARKGRGDMAVSSSIGSNIFDILVGLPLPWLMYNITEGSPVGIESTNIGIMVFSLFLMVAFVCLSIHFYGWSLNDRLAYTFVALYLVFVTEIILLETPGVFSSC